MKKVIAFTGHKLNGKTTASNHLMQRFLSESETPIKVERINMKDSIVEEMIAYLPGVLAGICGVYGLTTGVEHRIVQSVF
jgi:SOS response regulatory protein OraA/RecX